MQAVSFTEVPAGRVAYRKVGSGPPLLCVHGWPFSSLSFRHVAREFAKRFTCYFTDTPGLGETEVRNGEKLTFANQAETFRALLDAWKLDKVSVLATDTGASISRRLALIAPERIERLAIMNTEMPGHRPPWIPFFQKTTLLPGSATSFRLLLKSRAFQHSSMGFGGCFVDKKRIDDPEFQELFVRPLLEKPGALDRVIRYLQGIDWKMVDDFAQTHRELRCPVLLVWGRR